MTKRTFGKWIIAAALIGIGLALGVTWTPDKFCLGDRLFLALGLPAWSNGTTGAHYPAIVGSIFLLIGIGFANSTLPEKIRRWISAAILLLIAVCYFLLLSI